MNPKQKLGFAYLHKQIIIQLEYDLSLLRRSKLHTSGAIVLEWKSIFFSLSLEVTKVVSFFEISSSYCVSMFYDSMRAFTDALW
jgi:hypothetical protein